MSIIITFAVLLAIVSCIFGGALTAKKVDLNLTDIFRMALIVDICLFLLFLSTGFLDGLLSTTLFGAFGFSYVSQKVG